MKEVGGRELGRALLKEGRTERLEARGVDWSEEGGAHWVKERRESRREHCRLCMYGTVIPCWKLLHLGGWVLPGMLIGRDSFYR